MWKERQPVVLDEYGLLECPKCGGEYLHQGNTTIYERGEDADYTTVIAQNEHEVVATKFPSEETHNPSSRRHGLTIEFTCENCHGGEWDGEKVIESNTPPFHLAIYQHKGCTFMEWVK